MNIWYQELAKPPYTPPATYFPIAWGVLYSLMAIAFFIVLTKPNSKNKSIAISLFLYQLIFNFAWSYIFFNFKSINLALFDIIILLLLLLLTIIYFFKVSKTAGWLLIPYLLQVIFAIYLNLGILILNWFIKLGKIFITIVAN